MPYHDGSTTASSAAESASDAATLIATLTDCCHPRAARLKERLESPHDADQLAALRGEVLNVLALSFGPAEAQRRLREYNPP